MPQLSLSVLACARLTQTKSGQHKTLRGGMADPRKRLRYVGWPRTLGTICKSSAGEAR